MLVPFHQGGPHQRIGVCFPAAPEEDRRLGDPRRADAEVVGIPDDAIQQRNSRSLVAFRIRGSGQVQRAPEPRSMREVMPLRNHRGLAIPRQQLFERDKRFLVFLLFDQPSTTLEKNAAWKAQREFQLRDLGRQR